MGGPHKIVGDVYLVGGSEITNSMDCCVYLVDAGELVLIDSGAGKSTDKLVDSIHALGLAPEKISTILVTHAHIDHIGSLHDLRQRFGTRIIAHIDDSAALETGAGVGAEYYGVRYEPCVVDIKLQGEENTLHIGTYDFDVVHVPGHTAGSVVITVKSGGKKVLFGQDIHGPYHPRWGGDVAKAITSLEKIQNLNGDVLCEGHYGVIQPADAVTEFIQEFRDALAQAS
jgi:metallo-beta-lactamase class B